MITLPTTSMGSLKHFLRTHRDLMFQYVVKEVARGIDEDAHQVNLFQFGETNLIAAARKPQFGVILKQALDFFKQRELYEDAAQCRDVLRKIYHEADVIAVEDFLKTVDNEGK